MQIKKNCLYKVDCQYGLSLIPDQSVDLCISDPPYWKVVGEKWDYQWRTEPEYIEWCQKWLYEVSRSLRLGGSFYLFGYFRTLSKLVSYCESIGLELRQQIIIDKGMRSVSGRATKNYKLFPNVTESVLFFVKDPKPFIRSYLKSRQNEKGLTSKEINEALGIKSNGGGMWSIYTGKNVCEQVPTKELWTKLSNILDFDLEYESITQTYNPQMGLTDVWGDIDFYDEERYHPTQKPLKLISRLILASSNKGDIVVDPFVGAGSTAIAAKNLHRKYIGFDISEEYIEKANIRLGKNEDLQPHDNLIQSTLPLFS